LQVLLPPHNSLRLSLQFGGGSHHATVVQGAVTSCYELGCSAGALAAMYMGGKYGRKVLIILGSFIIIIGTLISIFPFKGHWALGHFVIARVVTGVGTGFDTVTIDINQSELSDPKYRGRLVNLEGSFVAVGTLIAYWIDFGLSYATGSVSFFASYFCCCCAILHDWVT
jgi:MFS family permease